MGKTGPQASNVCESCGGALPPGIPAWKCPTCRLELGQGCVPLEDAASGGQTTAGSWADVTNPAGGLAPHGMFGDYELLELVGRGGMGVVYKARQRRLDRLTALKMIRPEPLQRPDLFQRFQTEARIVARLQHPGIVTIYEVGDVDGQPYFSMEYVEGGTLDQYVRRGTVSAKRAAEIVAAVSDAIHYAHQQGVLHRDLKPSNILLDGLQQPRVTDFGVAKWLDGGGDLTLTGETLGTPSYMAPEQAEALGEAIGPRTDVYALGAMLYHLVSGRPPFVADTTAGTLAQVVAMDPIPLRRLNPSIPRDIETICAKCLEKDPRRRFESAKALAEDLGRYLRTEPIRARPLKLPGRVWRWSRRRPAVAGLLVAVVGLVLAGLAGSHVALNRIREEQLRTRRQLYGSDIILAQDAVEDGQYGRALDLLDRHGPSAGQEDIRGWEWRYLWGLCQGDAPEHVLGAMTGGIYKIAVSPDGNRVAASAMTGQVGVWDVAARQRLIDAQEPNWPQMPWVAWTPDGRYLLHYRQKEAKDGLLRLWDVERNRVHREITLEGHVTGCAISPDSRRVAMFGEDQQLLMYDLETGNVVTRHRIPLAAKRDAEWPEVGRLVFSRDGSRLYSADSDGSIREWDLNREDPMLEIPAHQSGLTALALAPFQPMLASASRSTNAVIRLWDRQTGELLRELRGHRSWISSLAFSPDGTTLVSGAADLTVRLWDVDTGQQRRVFRGHRNEVWSVAFLPDGQHVVSGCRNGHIAVWDLLDNIRRPSALVHFENAKSGAVPLEGKAETAVVVNRDGGVELWDARYGERLETLEGLGTNNWCAVFTPDEASLMVGEKSGVVRVWDLAEGKVIHQWRPEGSKMGWIWFLRPPENLFGTITVRTKGEAYNYVELWKPGTWESIGRWLTLPPNLTSWRGKYLVRGREDDVQVLEVATGKEVYSLPKLDTKSWCLTFSVDESQLAVLYKLRNEVELLDLEKRTPSRTLRGRFGQANWSVFAPCGRRLVVCEGPTPMMTFWDIESGQEIFRLNVDDSGFVYFPRFYGSGNCLMAAGIDTKRMYLWRAPSFAEIEEMERTSPWSRSTDL